MIERFQLALPHGITLSCRAAGARGRPVLVFLHGFPEAAFVWDELLAHFARPENGGYRCIAPNLRGYEQSSAPTEVSAYRARHLVQDIAALIASEGGRLECLVAHDWGGAVAWSLANQLPQLTRRLAIVNSPHPGTFLRELQRNPRQQQASAYMNFLIRPDAEALLAQDDYRRLWAFFTQLGGAAWLTEALKAQYREVWNGPAGRPAGRGTGGRLQLLPRLALAAAAARRSGRCRGDAAARDADGGPADAGAVGDGGHGTAARRWSMASRTTCPTWRWSACPAPATGSCTSVRSSWPSACRPSWRARFFSRPAWPRPGAS